MGAIVLYHWLVLTNSVQSGNPMFAFLKAVGVSLTNLDVPFTMNALFLPNVFCSQTELTTQIINHYTNEGIMQGTLLRKAHIHHTASSLHV